MTKHLWEKTLVQVRGNRWLRPMGKRVLRIPGAGGVLRRFMHGVLPKGKRIWVQIPTGPAKGLWLKVEPYLEEQYMSGCPEPAVQAEIVKHLHPGGCFYDVGAHIGYYSLLAARLVGRQGRAVAFEPDPINAAALQENLSRNNLHQVEVIPAAVWNVSGQVKFQRSSALSPEVSSRRGKVAGPAGEGLGAGLIESEAVTLDAFAQNHPVPTMIKIDVEGAEAEVLQGAQRLISQARPIWLIEVHHQQAMDFLEENFRQNGYRTDWLARHPQFPFPRHLLAQP